MIRFKISSVLHKLTACTVSVALLVAVPVSAAPGSIYLASEEQRERGLSFANGFTSLAAAIPEETFDVDARAETLGYEIDEAIKFVETQIYFDPYVGILRGPSGTLRAEAGSAWDQATLLVSLIQSMGGEAMIAQGDLSSKDAERLLATTFKQRDEFSAPYTMDVVRGAFSDVLTGSQRGQLESALGQEPGAEQKKQELLKLAESVTGKLRGAMAADGKPIADTASADGLVDQLAGSYVWVRYRDTPNDNWRVAHPAFSGEQAPTVEPSNYIANTAPKEWVHFLKIELEIERTANGKATMEAIMSPYSGTVASFSTHHTQLDISPTRLPSSDTDNPEFYTPSINGRSANGAKAFNLLGFSAPAEDVAAGPAIFGTVTNKFGSALTGISEGAGDEDAAPRLTGLVMKVTHTAPGGETKTEVRRLADFREATPGDAWKDLTQSIIFGVMTGPTNGAHETKGVLEKFAQMSRMIPYSLALADGEISVDDALQHPAFKQPMTAFKWPNLVSLANAFYMPVSSNQAVVRSAPLIINRRVNARLDKRSRMRMIVDIMHNDASVIVVDKNKVALSPALTMKQGVWETIVENFASTPEPDLGVFDAEPAQVVDNSNALDVVAGEWSKIYSDRIYADLHNSGAVVTLQGSARWWRVNPATGQALGMDVVGGSPMTEAIEVITLVTGAMISVFFFHKSVEGCAETFKNSKKMRQCCIEGNLYLTWATAGASGVFSGSALSGLTAMWSSVVGFLFGVKTDTTAYFVGGRLIENYCGAQ